MGYRRQQSSAGLTVWFCALLATLVLASCAVISNSDVESGGASRSLLGYGRRGKNCTNKTSSGRLLSEMTSSYSAVAERNRTKPPKNDTKPPKNDTENGDDDDDDRRLLSDVTSYKAVTERKNRTQPPKNDTGAGYGRRLLSETVEEVYENYGSNKTNKTKPPKGRSLSGHTHPPKGDKEDDDKDEDNYKKYCRKYAKHPHCKWASFCKKYPKHPHCH